MVDDAAVAAQGGRQVAEVLQKRVGASESKVGELRQQVSLLNEKINVNPGDAWQELEYLNSRNRLLSLADRAIQQADRAALETLREAAADTADQRLQDGAKAEVARVGAAYQSGLRAGSYTLPVGQLFPALRQKSEGELGAEQLIKVLGDSAVRPEYRAKAAYLLADHRSGLAADALAGAIASDPHLDVVREACLTFCEMTGYRTTDHLDWERVARWWAANKIRVKSVLGSS